MKQEWIYINNHDNSSRYALGTKGEKTLFCFGINPSTASPEKPDSTIRKVDSISRSNGYDSWIMLNVYPKRDTVFENLSDVVSDTEHQKNIETILEILSSHQEVDIWVAFGNHIYDRDYLFICLMDIYRNLSGIKTNWFATGVNKTGAPKHPLYQKNNAQLEPFDMCGYVEIL